MKWPWDLDSEMQALQTEVQRLREAMIILTATMVSLLPPEDAAKLDHLLRPLENRLPDE